MWHHQCAVRMYSNKGVRLCFTSPPSVLSNMGGIFPIITLLHLVVVPVQQTVWCGEALSFDARGDLG
jgi:hypothetical protein